MKKIYTTDSLREEMETAKIVYLTEENARKFGLLLESRKPVAYLNEKELYDFTSNFFHLSYINEKEYKQMKFIYTIEESLQLNNAQRTLIEVSHYSFIGKQVEVYLSPYPICEKNKLGITNRTERLFIDGEIPVLFMEKGIKKDMLVWTEHSIYSAYSFEEVEKFLDKPLIEKRNVKHPLYTKDDMPHISKEFYKDKITAYTKKWNGKLAEVFDFEKILEEKNLLFIPAREYQKERRKKYFTDNDLQALFICYWDVDDSIKIVGYTEDGTKIKEFKEGLEKTFGLIEKIEKNHYVVPFEKLSKLNRRLKSEGYSLKKVKPAGITKNGQFVFDTNEKAFQKIRIKLVTNPL